ncbi:MAG: ECF transporter S component [Huintestinicola sp.]
MKTEIIKSNTEVSKTRQLTVTAIMGALSAALMFIQIPVPMFMPGFIKFDISELPALIASFAIGPLSGACVCLIKNLINLLSTSTGGVGELSNFILGCAFVVPAGLIYKAKKTRARAIIGAVVGAVVMALFSIVSNYFFVYPIYTAFMPMEAIIGAYQALNPKVETLLDALIMFNVPFTFIKGMVSTVITIPIYKYLSPILKKGTGKVNKKAEA